MAEDRHIQKVTVEFTDGKKKTWSGKGTTEVVLTHTQQNYSPAGPHQKYLSVNMLLDEE